MDLFPSTQEYLLRLLIAPILGGLIGIEREWRQKSAGTRTHMMVSLGAAIFTLLALDMFARIESAGASTASVDPIRVFQGVMAGLGFIGGGSILRANGSIEGLTTAGGLWVAGSVGLAVGGGLYVIAVAAVVMSLVILRVVQMVEDSV